MVDVVIGVGMTSESNRILNRFHEAYLRHARAELDNGGGRKASICLIGEDDYYAFIAAIQCVYGSVTMVNRSPKYEGLQFSGIPIYRTNFVKTGFMFGVKDEELRP